VFLGDAVTVLRFSHSLYSAEAVATAAEAFAAIATLALHDDGDSTLVEVSWTDPEVVDLLDHFCNHVLHATVVAERRS